MGPKPLTAESSALGRTSEAAIPQTWGQGRVYLFSVYVPTYACTKFYCPVTDLYVLNWAWIMPWFVVVL